MLLYEKESYEIRGACFSVFNSLCGGIREKTIERALVAELKNRKLVIEQQKRIDILYKDERVGVYIPDVVVNGIIIIELKSKPFLAKEDEKQFWGYLKGSHYKLGFLINFGPQKLSIKRFIYDKNNPYKSV